MVIHRLAYPSRLNRMEETFRGSVSAIFRLVNQFIKTAVLRWDQLLTWDRNRLTPVKLEQYAGLYYEKSGGKCNAIIRMIDGTAREIPKPSTGQQSMFNGHKHMHAIKYQAIVAPDGIVIHISKVYPGSANDYGICKDSGVVEILVKHSYDQEGNTLAIYGDAAYEPDGHMIVGYKGHISSDEEEFNTACNDMRIIVEWALDRLPNSSQGLISQDFIEYFPLILKFIVDLRCCSQTSIPVTMDIRPIPTFL